MRFWVLLILLTLFAGCSTGHRTTASVLGPTIPDTTVVQLQDLGYFSKLDFNLPEIAAEIPEFENHLVQLLDHPASGLVIAYVAMYMVNSNYGAQVEKISYPQLTKFRTYSTEQTLDSELQARNVQITQLLRLANILTPGNVNIESWLMGSEIRENNGRGMSRVIALLDKDPIFSLFSALILANEFPLSPEEKARLFQAVEFMTGKDSPCRKKDRDGNIPLLCQSTELVPYGHQGAFSMLGDAYLKRGNDLLLNADTVLHKEGWHDIGMSLILYESLYLSKGAGKTRSWSRRTELNARMDAAKKIMLRRVPDHDLDLGRTSKGGTIYQCASCHSN